MQAGHTFTPCANSVAYPAPLSITQDYLHSSHCTQITIDESGCNLDPAPTIFLVSIRDTESTAIHLRITPQIVFFAVLLLAITLIAGCTHVQVYGASVETESKFGIAFVKITPEPGVPSVVITEGVGLTVGEHSTTIGWGKEQFVTFPDATACRVLIIVEKYGADRLSDLLVKHPTLLRNICVTRIGS